MKLYAPFIKEATLRVTMTLRSEGHGGDPSPKLQVRMNLLYSKVLHQEYINCALSKLSLHALVGFDIEK